MVESLRRRAGQFGLDIILVNVWEGVGAAEEAAGYCQRWGIEAAVLLDQTARYARTLDVRGVPINVFVDERGTVRAIGATTSEELLAAAAVLAPGLRDARHDVLRASRLPTGFADADS